MAGANQLANGAGNGYNKNNLEAVSRCTPSTNTTRDNTYSTWLQWEDIQGPNAFFATIHSFVPHLLRAETWKRHMDG